MQIAYIEYTEHRRTARGGRQRVRKRSSNKERKLRLTKKKDSNRAKVEEENEIESEKMLDIMNECETIREIEGHMWKRRKIEEVQKN